ncbi:MAG: hypothetical protein WD738_14675 [Pirellulales bacterium]
MTGFRKTLVLLASLVIILLALDAAAQPVQYAEIHTGFGDPAAREDQTDPVFAEVEGVATEASQRTVYPPPNYQPMNVTSAGSSVVKARATAGSLAVSVYNGYLVGFDNYYGYADARTMDDVFITGGTPNGTATVALGAIINGGIGIYGSDAGADARAYFRFDGISSLTSDYPFASASYDEVFYDSAHGEEVYDDDGNLLPPNHIYEYGPRYDHRYVQVALDASGNGSFRVELWMDASAFEDGDENLYISAAAADYGDTLNTHLQPWSADFSITTASGAWLVRPFGTALSVSPPPVTLTRGQLGIPEPASAALLGIALAVLWRARLRNR